jgi:hypothetical protein
MTSISVARAAAHYGNIICGAYAVEKLQNVVGVRASLTCDSHKIGQPVPTEDKKYDGISNLVGRFSDFVAFFCPEKLLYILLVLFCFPKDPGIVIYGHLLYGLPATTG